MNRHSTLRPVISASMHVHVALSVVLLLIGVCACAVAGEPVERPSHWAQPVELRGVPNLHRVSEVLYRSAQPSQEGMANLKKMGIKTIVNLRSFHSDRDEIDNSGLDYEHIYMKAWHPEKKEAIRFLNIVNDPVRAPVLVHCQHGADRTGTMCAIYRIYAQGWGKEEAIEEMAYGGFGFHTIWKNLPAWIRSLDTGRLNEGKMLRTRGTPNDISPYYSLV